MASQETCRVVGADPVLVRAAERMARDAGFEVRGHPGPASVAVVIEESDAGRARWERELRQAGALKIVLVSSDGSAADAWADAWLATIDLVQLPRVLRALFAPAPVKAE